MTDDFVAAMSQIQKKGVKRFLGWEDMGVDLGLLIV
jgi:hypothetical protein